MKLAKYVIKKLKRMVISMFCLFLGITIQKFSKIFNCEWQIITWATCSMDPIFINTCIFRESEIRHLSIIFLFCYHNLWLHTKTSRLIERKFHKLIISWQGHSSLLWLRFSFNNCSYFATDVHFIKDLAERLNFLNSAYCYNLNLH